MFDKYYKKIEKLNSFDKKDILTNKFSLYQDEKLNIYYAPHNEIVNKNAKIFLVGITPGWSQTHIAYQTAKEAIESHLPEEQIKKECKRNSRFAGSMRKNLIEMLDDLNLNQYLGITSCIQLFNEREILLHTTSVIPYPVFIKGKNYTGSNPKILEHKVLSSFVRKYFYEEVKLLPKAFYIPLGKAVEEILECMVQENILKSEQCLFGFPHPSGANGHRKKQLEENKENLKKKIEDYFGDMHDC